MRVGIGVLAALALLACGGRAPPQSAGPEERSPHVCTWTERKGEFCASMAAAQLTTAEGNPLEQGLELCDVTRLGARLRWGSGETGTSDFVATFSQVATRSSLRPAAILPLGLAWPERGAERPRIASLSTRLGGRCSPRTDTFRLDVASETDGTCVASAWLVNETRAWCDGEYADGVEQYLLDSWLWNHEPQKGLLHLTPTRLRVEFGERSFESADAQLLATIRARFDAVWGLQPEVSESCRDGAKRVVRARRRSEWRVVSRFCSDPAGVFQLVEDMASGAKLSQPMGTTD